MRQKSASRSLIWSLAFLIVTWAGMEWLSNQMDQQSYPWRPTGSGRPTLTGIWVGPLITHSGQRRAMLLEIALPPARARSHRNSSQWLEGRVLICARPGRVEHFQAWGAPQDIETASRFSLAIGQPDGARLPGTPPRRLRGQWGGKDSIILSEAEQGKSTGTGPFDPDTIGKTPATLMRGTEADFNALCKRLPMRTAG